MKNKDKKKRYVIVSRQLYPSQINELSICAFIIKKHKLDDLLEFIVNNGGRVISAVSCAGVSRNEIVDVINGYSFGYNFVLAMCQKEITDIFMMDVVKELEINTKSNGKAFVLDVLGYMGAKGPFVE